MEAQKKTQLMQVYHTEPDPAFGFGEDLLVDWVNPACEKIFPRLVKDTYLPDAFPDFELENLQKIIRERGSGIFRSQRSGNESLSVVCYGGTQQPFYVGSYRGFCDYWLHPDDEESAGGVRLLSYYVRHRVFGLLNHLDLLADMTDEAGLTDAEESVGRIEEGALALLRLCTELECYYQHSEFPVLEPVMMEEYLLELFRALDFRMVPAGVRMEYQVECGDAVCLLEKKRFETGFLHMVAAAVRYLRMSGAQDGSITFRCGVKSGELRMLLQDTCSDFSELRSRDSVGTYLKLDTTGEVLPLKRMGYELLEQAVENSDGSCLLENGNPGVRLLIRLPLSSEKPRLADEPAYRASNDSSGRASLMNIILADLL